MTESEAGANSPRQIHPSAYRTLACGLKRCIHRCTYLLASCDPVWRILSKTVIRISQFVCAVRNELETDRIVKRHPQLREALARRIVLHGPFKGLDYSNTRTFCSSLYPKLLGTYEHEIEGHMASALDEHFDLIVDVGAADGYYAVGFALKKPETKVIAFEQDPRARVELENLAEVNQVSARIEIRGRCDTWDLLKLPYEGGLLVMDCEGHEENLLTPEVISHLRHWDFIIETHDGYSAEMTSRLIHRFRSTHKVERIEAVHDFNRVDGINLPLLQGIPRRECDLLLAEGRQHACLRWIACRSIA